MSDLRNENVNSTNNFNVLSFERKLVELVEELRMRRNFESEGEKTLQSVLDDKYKEELNWDEEQRTLVREKEYLEQQIEVLRRKLEDKGCISDDKAKLKVMNKTYSQEIRVLKEELRTTKSETLNQQKTIQELEGKLSLHNKFQESIANQISEIRSTMQSTIQESQELANVQKSVMENVAETKSEFRKYDLWNQHLKQSVEIAQKKNESLKKELISYRSDLSTMKNPLPAKSIEHKNYIDHEKAHQKILELEQLILLSRRENEKTLNNFLESNKLMCKFMDKYTELQGKEKLSSKELELCREKLNETEKRLEEALDHVQTIREENQKQKKCIENLCSSETQTENTLNGCSLCQKKVNSNTLEEAPNDVVSSNATTQDFVEELRNDLMELQKSAVVRQSEMYPISDKDNDCDSENLTCANDYEKCDVLKRKLVKSGLNSETEPFLKRQLLDNNKVGGNV